jgi:hypothetical protein
MVLTLVALVYISWCGLLTGTYVLEAALLLEYPEALFVNQEGVHCMKITGGVLAALLLVTTVAVGQYAPFTEPFPQSANPALANGAPEESSTAVTTDMPSSMASQSGTYAERSGKFDLGSPFPSSANPSNSR